MRSMPTARSPMSTVRSLLATRRKCCGYKGCAVEGSIDEFSLFSLFSLFSFLFAAC